MNPMMPEQQSFVLYTVVGSGSKSSYRLRKTAPGAVFKVRLYGSLATGQNDVHLKRNIYYYNILHVLMTTFIIRLVAILYIVD